MNLLSHSSSKTKNGSSGGSQSSLSEAYEPTNGVPDAKTTIWQEIDNRQSNMNGSGRMLNNVTGAVSTLQSLCASSSLMASSWRSRNGVFFGWYDWSRERRMGGCENDLDKRSGYHSCPGTIVKNTSVCAGWDALSIHRKKILSNALSVAYYPFKLFCEKWAFYQILGQIAYRHLKGDRAPRQQQRTKRTFR